MKEISREAIEEIIECAHMMEAKGLMNAFEGNISVKREGLLYITPSGKSKATLTSSMIAVIDEEGRQIAGDLKASSELPMHTAMYSMREGVCAVAHAHPPYLTAYAICHKEFTCDCYPEFLTNYKEIKVAPYGAPGTHDICAGVKPLIQDHYLVLLANHGALAIGSTAAKACNRLDAAEATAKILSLAKQIGGTPVPLPEAEIKRIRAIIKPM
jgi:L-fuculose-phosphate aldolase